MRPMVRHYALKPKRNLNLRDLLALCGIVLFTDHLVTSPGDILENVTRYGCINFFQIQACTQDLRVEDLRTN